MTKTRGIVEAGAEYRTPAGLFQGMTLESVSGPAFEFTEDGQPVQPGHTFGAGVVVVRRTADGNSDDSAFVLTEPGDGTGGGKAGRGIATMTISGGNLTGTYTDGTSWDAGAVPPGPAGPQGPKGDAGSAGTPGAAATVAIGTVTTLAPGAQATVKNTGTPAAAVLEFGIPRGADGTGGGELPAGGTTGQVLTKRSATDGDIAWTDAAGGRANGVSLQYVRGVESHIRQATFTPDSADDFIAVSSSVTFRWRLLDAGPITNIQLKSTIAYTSAQVISMHVYDGTGTTGATPGTLLAQGQTAVSGDFQYSVVDWALDREINVASGQELVVVLGETAAVQGGGQLRIGFTNSAPTYVGVAPQGSWVTNGSGTNTNVYLRVFRRTDTPKDTVNALDPVDFPRSTPAAAPNSSGFMVVDDAAKTASLYWKFSDGSTKKVDLT